MPVQTQLQQRRGTAASWTSTNPTLAAGEIGFESDTGKIKIGTGSTAWNALAYTASSTAVTYLFNATAAQTTFSGADANGLTLAYTVGAEQVYLNGALQVRGSDYTATNGTSIVLTSGALVNDVLNVIAFSALALSDTYTQAQADARFVQQSTNFFAGKNRIINGDFGVWQRGTSFSTNNVYTADRWYVTGDGSPTFTLSQQTFTAGTAPVAGYEGQYFARYAVTSAGGSTYRQLQQQIEDVRTFAGQTITISFWARINSGTVTGNYVRWNQIFGSGGSATVNGSSNNFTLTSSWQRFTVTTSVTSISGKTIGTSSYLGIDFVLPFTTTMSVDFWGVQVEAGSIATPFQTATGTIQGELAACQRYYWRFGGDSNYQHYGVGMSTASTTTSFYVQSPVAMRATPTVLDFSTLNATDNLNYNLAVSNLVFSNAGRNGSNLVATHSAGATTLRPAFLTSNNSLSGYVGFGAEL
jgi:hypothetical protein